MSEASIVAQFQDLKQLREAAAWPKIADKLGVRAREQAQMAAAFRLAG